jgi:SAM-dependent methyltransferase
MASGAENIFDRELYLTRLNRTKPNRPDILSNSIATELAERLDPITREFNRACLIAIDPEPIAAAIRASGKVKNLVVLEPPASEILPLTANAFDAIFDILDLHLVNDVPGRLIQLRRALIPDGLLMACLFAGQTLNELRQSWLEAEDLVTGGVSPRVAPMIDVREMGGLLQRADLALPVVDLDRTIVRYPDAIALIHEIRSLGLSNVMTGRSRKPVTRNLLGEAISIYQQKFSDDDGRIRATIEVAWATAWSPHESQQKPLKPGSAKFRLADALKVPETKLNQFNG